MDSPVKNILEFDFRQTILLVDDRADNLASLEAILDNGRRQLIKAGSGEEALQILLDLDISLVLLDVQMPVMNGYEVARLMRGNRRTRNIPIIFITAIARDEAAKVLAEIKRKGMTVFELSPEEITKLRERSKPVVEKYTTELGPIVGEMYAAVDKARKAK